MKLSIYYPVTPVFLNQGFGENGAYYQAHGINIIGHNGYDLAANHGEPVYASHDGQAWYEVDASQGHGVVIRTNEKFDYLDGQAYYKTLYWHLCDSTKEPQFRSPVESYTDLNAPGLPVKAGDLIGYADTTGLSTGDHLHWGLKPVMDGETPGTFYNPAQQNGYLGAIDPGPYLNGRLASDISSRHLFQTPMQFGDKNAEVVWLQKCLQRAQYFPSSQECTGFYGAITRNSVYQFQKDNFVFAFFSRGSKVGPSTLTALNNHFS